MKKTLFALIIALVVAFPVTSSAQALFTASELDTLVSTIALYPDPLLAHVLTASTHREEIPYASRWANAHKNLKGQALADMMEEEGLDCDESILALIPFPTILATMNEYSAWTKQLGKAVYNQNSDVMDAVQRMRSAAYAHGNLRTDDYVNVKNGATITIEPVRTEYVYVPVYSPNVYYVYTDRYVPMHYGYGVWVGGWLSGWAWADAWFEWGHHAIHHPAPPRHYRAAPRPEPAAPRYSPSPAPRNERRLPGSGNAPARTLQKSAPSASMAPSAPSAPKAAPRNAQPSQAPARVAPAPRSESRSQGNSSGNGNGGFGGGLSRTPHGNSDCSGNSCNQGNNGGNGGSGGFHRSMR